MWTGTQACSGSADLPGTQGKSHWDVSFTLPYVTSLYTNTHSSVTPTSHSSVVLPGATNVPMSRLLWVQLQLIYTVATHYGALFLATLLLLNVTKYFMKANRQANNFKSVHVSLLSSSATRWWCYRKLSEESKQFFSLKIFQTSKIQKGLRCKSSWLGWGET